MKKRIASLLLVVVMVMSLFPATAFAAETVSIGNETELFTFAARVNDGESDLNAVLTDDITVNSAWTPIGLKTPSYSGTFDGRGHMITINGDIGASDYYGLFNTVSGTIQDVTVAGTISVSAGNVGGIAGRLEKIGTITGCINEANVTGTLNAGGIAGMAMGTITDCGNDGDITTTTSNAAGGIIGTSSIGVSISGCYNAGTITAEKLNAGGIAGSYSAAIPMSNCYNSGEVLAKTGQSGGIIGITALKALVLSHCYNVGGVSAAAGACGGIIGREAIAANQYTNCYYLTGTAAAYAGTTNGSTSTPPVSKSAEEIKALAATLGDGFAEDTKGINNGYPILTWQGEEEDPRLELSGDLSISGKVYVGGALAASYDGQEDVTYQWYREGEPIEGADEAGYTVAIDDIGSRLEAEVRAEGYFSKTKSAGTVPNYVAFDVKPETAVITVRDSDSTAWNDEFGLYALPSGTYTYTVTDEGEYLDASGSFTVPYTENDGVLSVALAAAVYDLTFEVTPADALFLVKQSGVAVDPATPGTTTYQLAKGEYTYSLSAFGYEAKLDEPFSVTGNQTIPLALTALPMQAVDFAVTKATGGPDTAPIVLVRDEGGTVRDETQGLPAGSYHYGVVCSGYQSVRGSFTVQDSPVQLPVTLAVSPVWGGDTVSEPIQDAGDVYLISSTAELFWFGQNAGLDTNAKLVGDITVNEDMSIDEGDLYPWTPKGTSSAKFAGSFDGGGYTISGLYIKATKGTGFIGVAGNTAEVKNLTVSGQIIGQGNYTGAIVGDCYGTIENCHSLASVSGTAYVGGVVGDLEGTSTMRNCSSRGSVIASGMTAGGVVGRIDSTSSAAVQTCYNTGAVQGAGKVGGVVGDQYGYGSAVSNVYNTGAVTATDGYAGGILGNFRVGTLENAYMACTVTGATDSARGKIVGQLEAARQEKALINVHYLDIPAFDVIANENSCAIQTGAATGNTSQELADLAPVLGDAFTPDETGINGGYPVLKWQVGQTTDPDAPTPDPGGWDGSATAAPALETGVYQIGSAAELAWFANRLQTYPASNGVLTAEIDLNHQPWTPMCGTAEAAAFTGTFDGAGRTIQNLYISSRQSGAALFMGSAGTIQNLTVAGQVHGGDDAAAIAAYNYGTLENCHSTAAVSGGNRVGGVTAQNYGEVIGCSGRGSVSASSYAGGVVAVNKDTVQSSFNTGMVQTTGAFSGGVVAANEGQVTDCYNTGLVVGKAAVFHSYVGGVVAWNNGAVSDLYNTGSVVSTGSYVGGAVGLTTAGESAQNLYGIGDVMGMYYDDSDGHEQHYVGGAVGRKDDMTSNAYYLDSLAVLAGGTSKSEAELKSQGFPVQLGNRFARDTAALNGGYPILAWQTGGNTPAQHPALGGEAAITGALESGSTLTATYTGEAEAPLFVWYTQDADGEYVHAIGKDTYLVPVTQVGQTLRVKVFSAEYRGAVSGAAIDRIQGMNGSVFLTGASVVGKTLTATYSRAEDAPVFQWYRGGTAISGAASSVYTIQPQDEGFQLKVRVTGNKAGYVEKALAVKVTTAEAAGVWADSACQKPESVGGVYVITTEQELHWFASEVNGGTGSLQARLGEHLTLRDAGWYPIGTDASPFTGTFDGNEKTIDGFQLSSTGRSEQGFFGHVAGSAEVKNLTVSGAVEATGESAISIGGIAGYVEGKVSGCTFNGSVSGHTQVGGIAGTIGLHGMVSECRNTAAVTGADQVGGIAGASSYGDTYYCINNGIVGGIDAENVGGIVGTAQNYAVILGCYNTNAVTGSLYVGGISGDVYVAAAPLGCYNVGAVTGNYKVGGVLGSIGGTDYISTVTGSFYLNTLPQDPTAAGKSQSAMKAAAFVRALNSEAFLTCYLADDGRNDGYPILTWEKNGHSSPEGGGTELPAKERITVSLTLLGDTVHGSAAHTGGTVTWISETTVSGLPNTTTAYDLFRQVLGENSYTYVTSGKSYVSSITNPGGERLAEFSNGPYSGWMYTINGVFPDYMSAVTLQDGDDMVFFYTDDYRVTGWNPYAKPGESSISSNPADHNQALADAVIRLISAIGAVTEDSIDRIEAARTAYDQLTGAQKDLVTNYGVLTQAEGAYLHLTTGLPFTDIAGHWALDAILSVYENDLMQGIGNARFQPDAAMDRAMMVTLLYRMEGAPAVDGENPFTDVTADTWYTQAVLWANESGVVNGIGDDLFAPHAAITREQIAAILLRYAAHLGYDTAKTSDLSAYRDAADVSGWALDAMEWAHAEGLVSGRTDGLLAPKGQATRAEAATLLMRFLSAVPQ